MASSNGEEPPSCSNTPPLSVAAKLMVATDGCECKKLNDLANRKQDTTTMVVVMASSEKKRADNPMHPLLLASGCCGDFEGLSFLLNGADGQLRPPSERFLEQLATYNSGNVSEDIEVGADMPLLSAELLLKGVTVEGDTALHSVATHGDAKNFLSCADLICDRSTNLLFQQNSRGDTPLHCAARAGNSEMVSHLIALTTTLGKSEDLLRKENNSKETVLHKAVRIGDNLIVTRLMEADPLLATFPIKGISPLFVAILLEMDIIAKTLYHKSNKNLSYWGPNGQNALHASVLRNQGRVTHKLLKWNKNLTIQRDEKGSTPLHFAASLHWQWRQPHNLCRQVFEANQAALYQADKEGLFPIHVAAAVGAQQTIVDFLKHYPSAAGLRDAKGRTFLHVAVEKQKLLIVDYTCRSPSLKWILNMQDVNGDTALHLAVKAHKLRMVCALLGNRQVQLNLPNKKGHTPFDIARHCIPRGLSYSQNTESRIRMVLIIVGARNGPSRLDHSEKNYTDQQIKLGQKEESQKIKDSTQTLSLGSVLIATVTFGIGSVR